MKTLQFATLATALTALGCGEPAVGIWHGAFTDEEQDLTWAIEVSLEDEGRGSAQISTETQGIEWDIDYDVEWEQTSRRQYTITLVCEQVTTVPDLGELGPTCESFADGDLTCSLNRTKDELDCEDEGGDPLVLSL